MHRPKFKVGDTAIGCRYFTLPDRNGMECIVVAPLRPIRAFEVRSGAYTTKPRYRVRWADGLESLAQPNTLRSKRASDEHRCKAFGMMRACLERIAIAGGVHA